MEYLEKAFKKTGFMSILTSVIFLIIGGVLIWKPEETIKISAYILGVIFIIIGICKIANYILSNGKYNLYNYDMIYGIIAIIIGIVTITYSNTIGMIFRIIIGIWIVYSAMIRISTSLKLKSINVKAWSYSLILAIIMLICGLYIIMNQGAIIVTIGIGIVIYSVIDIIEGIIFMKNVKEIF